MRGSTNAIKPLHHYSTTEQIAGTWIDGKPLYEKTITISGDLSWVSQKITIAHNVDNLEKGCVTLAQLYRATDSYNKNITNSGFANFNDLTGNAKTFIWGVNSTNIVCLCNTNYDLADCDLVITIQYTKTTDTAT